eukprot:Amastigsp_a676834_30.p2 type:complete len:270 gc:universal Amastigsp_a676834_30:557-1366(+)
MEPKVNQGAQRKLRRGSDGATALVRARFGQLPGEPVEHHAAARHRGCPTAPVVVLEQPHAPERVKVRDCDKVAKGQMANERIVREPQRLHQLRRVRAVDNGRERKRLGVHKFENRTPELPRHQSCGRRRSDLKPEPGIKKPRRVQAEHGVHARNRDRNNLGRMQRPHQPRSNKVRQRDVRERQKPSDHKGKTKTGQGDPAEARSKLFPSPLMNRREPEHKELVAHDPKPVESPDAAPAKERKHKALIETPRARVRDSCRRLSKFGRAQS